MHACTLRQGSCATCKLTSRNAVKRHNRLMIDSRGESLPHPVPQLPLACRDVRFFMYEHATLNHHWLRHCPRFRELRSASQAENTAEVGLHRVLTHHPARTWNASEAGLFYVPIFEYTSNKLKNCSSGGSSHAHLQRLPRGLAESHTARMSAARDALLASPHWHAHGGRDHFWASTAFSAHSYTLERRMAPLSKVLGCSTVGRYKAGPFARPSRVGECVIEIPYQASLHVTRVALELHQAKAVYAHQVGPAPSAVPGSTGRVLAARSAKSLADLSSTKMGLAAGAASATRSLLDGRTKRRLLFFAGSLDVCCTGRQIRCAIGEMLEEREAIATGEILIRPTGGGSCSRRALARLANRSLSSSSSALSEESATPTLHVTLTAPRARPGSASTATPSSTYSSPGRYVDNGLVERTAYEMASSAWCLCPAGDTCVTSRLYSAVAAGCLPVVLCDQLQGAFPSAVDYSAFWLKVPVKAFLAQPASLLHTLRALTANATEMGRRQRALSRAQADLLYDLPESRLGSRFLEAVLGRCLAPALRDRAVNGNSNRTASQAAEALAACTSALQQGRSGAQGKALHKAVAIGPGKAPPTDLLEDALACRRRAGLSAR